MGGLRQLAGPRDRSKPPPEKEKEEEDLQKTTNNLTRQSYHSSANEAVEADEKGRLAEVTVMARAM